MELSVSPSSGGKGRKELIPGRHSLFCDPGFIDADKRDFRLKEDSILFQYGFDFLNEMLKVKP